ncbi:MAG TPA: tRNA uridine-5-carboxymethylaminomethyl(34) synthesis GTPase MnmE [Limnobacter sp.]|uniref:tRNA uridine-5-carboxymethylaminomethyl(34) synthesis GTPase MnmE n=1 Tax=Limnobacter sp. TaxID=2003368 RepID=UPI002E34510B|nr:tRNA uridine-5-carboxymethylaminomethyl(34) synthesis GTPase MnmE [Limnobacter sp.]HEX5485481.1 tRNA uridine-5-carboxymethylaminomethyl(34) synthesis GTPase MnmE [Limnobacter sp.]
MGNWTDPIVAIATAPGKGGVGIVRFSFPGRAEFERFCAAFCHFQPVSRSAYFHRLHNIDGQLIDEGLILAFHAPGSYTGEHVLEFQGHGGPAVLQAVLQTAFEVARSIQVPLRQAEAGEFTQRAFLNDKLDLAQAEAVADLIDAGSVQAAKAAANSLSGAFSKEVNALADRITHLRLLLEATLDFPEEEIDFLEKANAKGQLDGILSLQRALLIKAQEGVRFNDGLQLVLVGAPNVGKSSLLNALAGEEIAIVTEVAGTTRDRIKQQISVRGVPIVVVDTAGLRETDDHVEKIGIERTRQSIQEADLLLHLVDATDANSLTNLDIEREFSSSLPVLRVLNKVDLVDSIESPRADDVLISAKTGLGLDNLKDRILDTAGLNHSFEHSFTARQRHVDALHVCQAHLELAAEYAKQDDRILDLFAEELRLAHGALGEITGRMLPDDLLGLIFSRFCIGK